MGLWGNPETSGTKNEVERKWWSIEKDVSRPTPSLICTCRSKNKQISTRLLSLYSPTKANVCRCLSFLRRNDSELEPSYNCMQNVSNRSQLDRLVFYLIVFLRYCKFPFPLNFFFFPLALISSEGREHSFVWQGENNFIFITSLTSPNPNLVMDLLEKK